MNPDATEDEIIARDQQSHPNCNYSVNFSQTCSSQNGEMVCETIRNLQRYCPGERPMTIYSKKDQYKGSNEDMEQHNSAFPQFRSFEFRSGGSSQGTPFDGFGGMLGGLDEMLGGFANEMFGRFAEDIQREIMSQLPRAPQQSSPSPQLPPHKLPPHGTPSTPQQPSQGPFGFGIFPNWGSSTKRSDDTSSPPKPAIPPGQITGPVEEI